MVTNNYKASVSTNIKIYFLVILHGFYGSTGELGKFRYSGDMTNEAVTISNIARCQARKKRILGDFISLFKKLSSGAFHS